MTLGRKFARPVAKWYLWPGHMLNQQNLYVRGQEEKGGEQYNRGPYNYGIKALSANRFRMWQILLCLLLLLLCMPQFEIKREGFPCHMPGQEEGLGSPFVAQIGGKENYVYAKWKERKKAWPKAARPRLVSPHLTSPKLVSFSMAHSSTHCLRLRTVEQKSS